MSNVTMTFTLEGLGKFTHTFNTFMSGSNANSLDKRITLEGKARANNKYFSKFLIHFHHIYRSDFFILDYDKKY